MRLTDYIKDLGRVVAFYPNLKKITNSTVASVLLCQLLYWTDKTDDGWIYKTHYDLEEETGLTLYEQKTARQVLVDLGIIDEEYRRLEHKIRFRVNQTILDDLWEKENHVYTGKEEPVSLSDYREPGIIIPYKQTENHALIEKQENKDMMDGMLFYQSNSPGAKKETIKNTIMDKIETKLHINVTGKKWKEFIEYAYGRQERHGEPIDRFIDWMLKNNPNSTYWTPERFQMLYPQAFTDDQNKPRENFAAPLPPREEKDLAPMPDELKRKRNLT